MIEDNMLLQKKLNYLRKKSDSDSLTDTDLLVIKKEFLKVKENSDNLYALINIIGVNGLREYELQLSQYASSHKDSDIVYISLMALMYHFSMEEKYTPILLEFFDKPSAIQPDENIHNALFLCTWLFKNYKHKGLLNKCLQVLFDNAMDGYVRATAHDAILTYLGLSTIDKLEFGKEEICSVEDVATIIKQKFSHEIVK